MISSKVKHVLSSGSFESQYGTPNAEGKKLMYKFEYTMEDGVTLTANHKTQTGNFKEGEPVEYEITKESEQYGKSGKVSKPDSGNYQSNASSASKSDPKVQGMIVKQNALGHATELLKHNAMMDNKKFLSKDVVALAQIYTDWVIGVEPVA